MFQTPQSDNVFVGDLPVPLTEEQVKAIFGAYGTVQQCKLLPPRQGKASALVRFQSAEEAKWFVDTLNGNIPEGLETPIVCRYANAPGGAGGGGGGFGAMHALGGKGMGKGKAQQSYGGQFGNDPYSMIYQMQLMNSGGKGKGTPGSFRELFGAAKAAGIIHGDWIPPECQLYIGNLPADTTDKGLYQLFSQFGAIAPSGCTCMKNDDGSCKGYGFVDFMDPDIAQTAVAAFNGLTTINGGSLVVRLKPAKQKGEGKGQ